MKCCTVFLQVGNLQCPSVPKPLISVLEKNFNRNINEGNCWFSHDVTKFQTLELLILLRFYFQDVLEQLKTNIQTNFHSEWVLGLVIDYA